MLARLATCRHFALSLLSSHVGGTHWDVPELKMFAPLQRQLALGLAFHTFQPQHHLLRRLGFFVEHRFGLAAVPRLLAVVSAFALREKGGLE